MSNKNLPDGCTTADIDQAGEAQVWANCFNCEDEICYGAPYYEFDWYCDGAAVCEYCADEALEKYKSDHEHTAED